MKPTQWILALVVLAGMVFFITMAMNFLGETDTKVAGTTPADGSSTQPEVGEPILTFAETNFHGMNGPYYDGEHKHAGYHDFLFVNPTDEEVQLGLNGVNCSRCTSVEVLLAPTEAKAKLLPLFHRAALPIGLMAQSDRFDQEVAEKQKPFAQLELSRDQKLGTKIPAQAAGWIRLKWDGEKAGPELYWAELWTKNKSRTAFTKVEAKVRLSEPAKFQEMEIALNDMQVEDLQNRQKPKRAVFKVWSFTRSQLHPKATLLSRWKPGEAPIGVGPVEPLSPPEVVKLERELEQEKAPGKITCAYRLPVTLLDRSADGKQPFPFGQFRLRIEVSFADEGVEPALLMVNGKLLGDVRIGGGLDGRLSFGSFDATQGTNFQHVMLYSEVPDLELEIDRERTPEFLLKNAKIEKQEATGGEAAWKVGTKVSKNSVVGHFPREDSEYFDCAVYVKTKGNASRSLCIPADGTAVVK